VSPPGQRICPKTKQRANTYKKQTPAQKIKKKKKKKKTLREKRFKCRFMAVLPEIQPFHIFSREGVQKSAF
jgi:hypothetical protein